MQLAAISCLINFQNRRADVSHRLVEYATRIKELNCDSTSFHETLQQSERRNSDAAITINWLVKPKTRNAAIEIADSQPDSTTSNTACLAKGNLGEDLA